MSRLKELFFSHKSNSSQRAYLDGLRGLAILIVLLAHSSNWNLFFVPQLNFQLAGRSGACLFFLLSSFLLSSQLIRSFLIEQPATSILKKFYGRRILRVYPLYIIGLLLFGVITFYQGKVGTFSYPLKKIPGHLLLIKGEGIFWTMAAELKYYLILPFLILICKKKAGHFKPIYSFLILAFFFTLLYAAWALSGVQHLPFVDAMPLFLTGTFTAICINNVEKRSLPGKRGNTLFEIMGYVSGILLFLQIPYCHQFFFGNLPDIKQAPYFVAFAFLWLGVLLAAKYGKGTIQRFLELKVLCFMGTISFSLYIFHIPLLMLIESGIFHLPHYLHIYLFFLLSILVATASYLLVEQPVSKLKFKWFP